MKNTETVKTELYKLFERYNECLISDNTLVHELYKLCNGKGKKTYWWRFFDNDTMANDAFGVNESLRSATNRKYLKECIEIALKEKQLTVYYS